MIQIAPSILSADFTRLGEELDAIQSADMVHFDVMDGALCPQPLLRNAHLPGGGPVYGHVPGHPSDDRKAGALY